MAWLLIVVCAVVFCIPFAMCMFDAKYGTQISCNVMGWHNGKGGNSGFDGASFTATCGKCGKAVLQDSQGNWF